MQNLNGTFNTQRKSKRTICKKLIITDHNPKCRNMKLKTSQINQLENDALPIEKSQELIYKILKDQLKLQRKEILRMKKLKRDQEAQARLGGGNIIKAN